MLLAQLVNLLSLFQDPQASIAGVVRDAESSAPLAEAMVALPDLDRSDLTDSLGRYRFADVPAGPQHLTVRRIGYAPRTLHAFAPEAGALQIDITLRPVPMQLSTLEVRTAVAMRGLESDSTPSPDPSVSLAAIRNDPFLAEPDGFLALTGGEVSTDPESPEGMHVRGAPSDQTGYLLDGIPVFSPYHAAGIFSAWNPDAIERVQLFSASPSPAFPEVLSGTVAAVTRAPGPVLAATGTMSSTQTRLSIDGPLGARGGGFLVSLRAGYPGWIAPRHDPSYLAGGTRDGLAKLEAPLLRGSLRLLFYETGNSLGAAVRSDTPRSPQNSFEWGSRSLGGQWSRQIGGSTLQVQGWSAASEAEARWLGPEPVALTAERSDAGLLLTGERKQARNTTSAGLRLEQSWTKYRPATLEESAGTLDLRVHTPVAAAFAQHDQRIGTRFAAQLAMSVSAAVGRIYLGQASQLRFRLAEPLVLSASYVRAHQFAQSLRNTESIVGNVFPAELYVGAGSGAVPVARNDREIIALDYRPGAGLRLGAQAYLSHSTGLVLAAPATSEPFAIQGFTIGSGTAPGLAIDAALRAPRFGLLASYSWQRLRIQYADSSYSPSYGASQAFELGGILFPTATSSLRLALTGAFGRRTTEVSGDFEWEACNLVDRGCQFAGTPQTSGPLGATPLPGYLRLDLGARQHWHFSLAGRDVMVALYGTVTNLLGRSNLLTIATDASGRRTAVEMRPRSPLVVGLDWRF